MSISGNLNENDIYEYQKQLSKKSKLFISNKKRCSYYDWHSGFCYEGTKSELIADGIAKDGWFPMDEGNNKTSLKVIFNDSLTDGVVRNDRARMKSGQRCLKIIKTGSAEVKFKIVDMYPKSIHEKLEVEINKQWEAEAKEREAKEEFERNQFMENLELRSRVNTKAEAKEKVLEQYGEITRILNHTYHKLQISGYIQSQEHIDSVTEALRELYKVFEKVSLTYDPDLRIKSEVELKHKTAKSNSKFNQFLQGLNVPTELED